jgi:hypothetical protein
MGWTEAGLALRAVLLSKFSAAGFSPPQVKCYLGWPNADNVLKDVRTKPAGSAAHVGIYATDTARNASRYVVDPVVVKVPPVGQLGKVDGYPTHLELLGSAAKDELYLIVINNIAYVYRTLQGDTKTTIINALVTLINTDGKFTAANVSGSFTPRYVLSVQNGTQVIYRISGEVFGSGIVTREVGRIIRDLVITIWASDSGTREKIADKVVNSILHQEFLDSADGCKIRIVYDSDAPTDLPMPSGIMRHDVYATVEYPAIEVETGVAQVAYLSLTIKPLFYDPFVSDIQYVLGSPSPLANTFHSHIYETPVGTRPGTSFTLTFFPKANSLQLTHNLLPQRQVAVGSVIGVNEYSILGNLVTTGNTIGSNDDFKARYEI